MTRRPVEFQKNGKKQLAEERSDRIDQNGDAQTLKGLCANCEKRFFCLLPEREGGVWHCEEYVEKQ